MEGALNDIEQRHGGDFLRVHRSALVARRALRALDRSLDARDPDGWVLRLRGVDEVLPVSRRQLAAVREALAAESPKVGKAARVASDNGGSFNRRCMAALRAAMLRPRPNSLMDRPEETCHA